MRIIDTSFLKYLTDKEMIYFFWLLVSRIRPTISLPRLTPRQARTSILAPVHLQRKAPLRVYLWNSTERQRWTYHCKYYYSLNIVKYFWKHFLQIRPELNNLMASFSLFEHCGVNIIFRIGIERETLLVLNLAKVSVDSNVLFTYVIVIYTMNSCA